VLFLSTSAADEDETGWALGLPPAGNYPSLRFKEKHTPWTNSFAALGYLYALYLNTSLSPPQTHPLAAMKVKRVGHLGCRRKQLSGPATQRKIHALTISSFTASGFYYSYHHMSFQCLIFFSASSSRRLTTHRSSAQRHTTHYKQNNNGRAFPFPTP